MGSKQEKLYCTIDHANKLREGQRDFNPYRYWLKQEEHREAAAARAQRNGSARASAGDKQQLA